MNLTLHVVEDARPSPESYFWNRTCFTFISNNLCTVWICLDLSGPSSSPTSDTVAAENEFENLDDDGDPSLYGATIKD
jgi:hypothetical protein